MIFNWIKIQNFGSYRYTPRIDLKPEKNKVVTLIGGKNGAGKSTFLEAIKCCLYGKRSRGLRARDVDYKEYLKKRRNYLQKEDEASVIEVSFTFFNKGEEEEYRVKRAWRLEGDKIITSLTILKNGFRFSAVNEEEWQNYLIDLIPPYILDLYLFDAEDMESLAINDGDNQFLGHSLKMMLGLQYSEQLINDLDLQLTRLDDDKANETKKEFKAVKKKIKAFENLQQEIKIKQGEFGKKQALLKKERNQIEENFRAKGGQFARQRDENEEEKKKLKEKLQHVEGKFQQLAMGNLPFLIAKRRLDDLKDQLEHEREVQTISEVEKMVGNRIKNETISPDTKENLKQVLDTLKDEFDASSSNSLMAKLSIKDFGVLENIIDGLKIVEEEVKTVVDQGNKINEELEMVNRKLNLTPDKDDTEIQQIFSQLQEKTSKIKEIETKLDKLEEQLRSAIYEEEMLRSEEQKLRLKLSELSKDKTVRNRIITAQQVLSKFIEKQKKIKIKELSDKIKENYAKICRKGRAVSKVDIDHETYTIRLYGPNQELWNKDFLSVGERQLLALSILWSLASVSNRDLPFIIDTPLGKLDEEHRQGLVDDFFAVASSQVVILSTNKEIDEHLYHDLKPHISHSYLISFDNTEQTTLLEQGYFYN